ncbi:SGNH/GDSL hydrolase family protein [Luteibacter rhizovicinus]|nr:SGNH/GDSL hydrolase family protein [Luteibacter rhizovicinus]
MSRNGHRVMLAALACISTVPGRAAAVANEAPASLDTATTTDVRCHFTLQSDPMNVKTDFVDAGIRLKGYWHSTDILRSRSMFFTNASPTELHNVCVDRIARISVANQLALISATSGGVSNNYDIWHNGDLAKGRPIERIVSFGDSLSDSRNMYNESQWLLPYRASWYVGRFSNGPIWVEHLAMRTGLTLNNWAVGGAQTKDAQVGLIQGVGKQIDSFFEYASKADGYEPSRTLFTFLIGGNDFVNDTQAAKQVVIDQEKLLEKLVAGGARRILIVNLPDLTLAPVFTMQGGRTDESTVLGKVEYYNSRIRDVVARIVARTEGTEIHIMDARKRFDELIASPATLGFTNARESCLEIDSPGSLTYLQTQTPRAGCTDPSTYVFWDSLHPTTRVHELIAQWAIEAMPASWGLRQE